MFVYVKLYIVSSRLSIDASDSQSHFGRAHRSRTTTQQSPHWLQWDAPNSPSKLPLPFDDYHPYCQAMWMYLHRGGVDAALLPGVIDRFSRQLESVRGRILRSQTRRLTGVCVAGWCALRPWLACLGVTLVSRASCMPLSLPVCLRI